MYDIKFNNNTSLINSNTIYQWYNINDITDDLKMIINNDIKLINLVNEPIETTSFFNSTKDIQGIKYNIKSIHFESGYKSLKRNVLDEIKLYLGSNL